MRSKRFRNYKFYPGDLVTSTWKGCQKHGIVTYVNDFSLRPYVSVLWQGQNITVNEDEIDIEVVSQVDRD